MGEVYEAKDTRLGRTVAIKVLPEGLAQNPQRRARFEREARAVSRLAHPHVCTLHDVGEEEGIHFLVLEHLEGETLARRLERGALSQRDTLRHGAEIAEALDAAHRKGVIHRDLKPANVMLTPSGVKLLDFGLARVAAGEGGEVADLPTLTMQEEAALTEEGTLLGTFPYMSPEQVEGKEADAQSDIFSLGAILSEMTTGRRAFDGESAAAVMAAVLREEPVSPSQARPASPPALDHVVSRCLAKDPEDRWQSARDVAGELRWIAEEGLRSPLISPSPRRWLQWLGWGIAGILAVSFALVGSPRPRPEAAPSPVFRAHVTPPEGTSFDLDTMGPGPVSVAPDGSRLVFGARDETGGTRLWIRRLAAEAARPLSGTEDAAYPFWSPDGGRVGFFAEGELRTIELTTGEIRSLCPALRGKGGTWNRQGVIVFAPSWDSALFRVSEGGGEPEQVTGLHGSTGFSHRFPVFLPGGRRFLYLAVATFTGTGGRIEVGGLDGREAEVLLPDSDSNVAYGADHLVFVRAGRLLARPFDPDGLVVSGEPVRLAEDVYEIPSASYAVFSLSSTGVLAYHRNAASPKNRLVWLDRSGRELATIAGPEELVSLSLSPDEDRVAVDVVDAKGRGDVRIYDVATGVATRLTSGDDHEFFPLWTPDGERVVYGVVEASTRSLQEASIRRGSEPRRLLEGSAMLVPWDVSPNGRHLLFGMTAEGSREISLHALELGSREDGSPPRRSEIAATSGFSQVNRAQFSPDGRWIALTAVEGAVPYVYLFPFERPGRAWKLSERPATQPRWRADGLEIFAMGIDGELVAMEVEIEGETFRRGPAETLFRVPPFPGVSALEHAFDVTAEGERFLFALPAGDTVQPPLTIVSDWRATSEDEAR